MKYKKYAVIVFTISLLLIIFRPILRHDYEGDEWTFDFCFNSDRFHYQVDDYQLDGAVAQVGKTRHVFCSYSSSKLITFQSGFAPRYVTYGGGLMQDPGCEVDRTGIFIAKWWEKKPFKSFPGAVTDQDHIEESKKETAVKFGVKPEDITDNTYQVDFEGCIFP